MSRYIDADSLYKKLQEYHEKIVKALSPTPPPRIIEIVFNRMIEYLKNEPKADVQEVLRCKDCKFYKVFSGIGHCGVLGICEPDDFCCRGERRKDNAEIHGVEH